MLTLSQYMLRLEVKDETLKQLLEEWKKNRVEMYEEKNNLIWLENHFLHDLEYKVLIINNIFIWRLFDWRHKNEQIRLNKMIFSVRSNP